MMLSRRLRVLLGAIVREHKRPMLLLLAFATLQTVVMTAGDPLLIKWLIDSISTGDMRLFVTIGCVAITFYTVTRILDFIYVMAKARVRLTVMSGYCAHAASLYFRQPYAEIRKHDKGYYHGRILDESQEISGLLDTSIDIYRAVVGFVSALAVCLWLSWQLALVISAIVPFLLYFARRYGQRISDSSVEVQENEAQLRDTLGQVIGSYKITNLLPGVTLPLRALGAAIERNVASRMRIARHSSLFYMVSGISMSYAEMAVMLAAGFAVISGELTIGGLFAFMGAYWRAVNSVQGLIDLTPHLARLDGIAKRLEEFSSSARPVNAESNRTSGDIVLDGVGVSLGDTPVLRELSFKLARGERLLVVGANGTGKSTLIDLLCGFRAPDSGEAALPPYGSVSCQFTEATFFPGTVRQNLEAFAETEADAWLERADLLASADQQPYLLSAGQQRKLQIAMTLSRDCPYYFFDEPLANLDDESKARFLDMILQHTAGKTLVVVVHGEPGVQHHFHQVLVLRSFTERPAETATERAYS